MVEPSFSVEEVERMRHRAGQLLSQPGRLSQLTVVASASELCTGIRDFSLLVISAEA